MLEDEGCVGAAEAEAVGQDGAELRAVPPLPDDRHIGESGIDRLDVGALADEAVVHHQQREDRLDRAGGTLGVPRQALRCSNGRALI